MSLHARIVLFLLVCQGFEAAMMTKLSGVLTDNLPPGMVSDTPGTWAHDTMSRRVVEEIIPRIINDNADELTQPSSEHRAECLLVINDLISSLQAFGSGHLRGIADSGPDVELWQGILTGIPDEKRNWRDAPWVVSEFYLYRRLVEAFKFFETGYDPFSRQKVSGLVEALPNIQEIAGRLPGLLATDDKVAIIELAVLTSLWGNKMDLSLWPASKAQSGNDKDIESTERINEALSSNKPYILDDHTEEVTRRLLKTVDKPVGSKGCVDIVVDNAGYELVSDMILGHCLLGAGVCDKVRFHTKGHPTFVSDATNEDCLGTIGFLMDADNEDTAALATNFKEYTESGKFEFVEDLFWCQPTAFWDMPDQIQERLQGSLTCFVKGDANYRRLLGERQWPLDTPANDVLSYWPVPVCALRTFKAEIGCGIAPADQQRAQEADAKWLVSGKWGVVQTD
jgi:hypothetical protein